MTSQDSQAKITTSPLPTSQGKALLQLNAYGYFKMIGTARRSETLEALRQRQLIHVSPQGRMSITNTGLMWCHAHHSDPTYAGWLISPKR
jgi:hypothetical protein